MKTGDHIAELSKQRGYSIKELARRADIPYTTLYSIIKRNSEPKYEILHRISDVLGVSVGYLQGTEVTNAIELATSAREKNYSKYEELLGLPQGSIFGDVNSPSYLPIFDWILSPGETGNTEMRTATVNNDFLTYVLDQLESIALDADDRNSKLTFSFKISKYACYYLAIVSRLESVLWWHNMILFSEDEIDAALGEEQKQELILETRLKYWYQNLSLSGKREAVKRIEELTMLEKYKKPQK